MSEGENNELTKSWVVLDSEKLNDNSEFSTNTVEDVHLDSDSESISVISESGCSYKTDDEENSNTTIVAADEKVNENEVILNKSEIIETVKSSHHSKTNNGLEKFSYYGTSALCAIILLGLSIATQQYFYGSNLDKLHSNTDQDYTSSVYVEKKKNHLKYYKNANDFHQNVMSPPSVHIANDDPLPTEDLKPIYKANKNKIMTSKANKENVFENIQANHDNYDKKLKELQIKEEYLKEKEMFLIEKEHVLLKKEIKFKKKQEGKKSDKKDKQFKNKREEIDNTHKYNKKKVKIMTKQNNETPKNEHYRKRNISGQWYLNLHKARDNIRQKEHTSDWIFDRARYRNSKRNKNFWYFQRMGDRARQRIK